MCLDEVFTRALNEVNGALKRRFITGLKNNSSICKLELEECDVSESGPGYDILNAFKERKSNIKNNDQKGGGDQQGGGQSGGGIG